MPSVHFFFQFHVFFGKMAKIIGWHPLPGLGNPGSATALIFYYCNRCELYDRENVVSNHTLVISISW